jgi:hypothetical protein
MFVILFDKLLCKLFNYIGGKMHARNSAPGVGGFSRPDSEASANEESGGWSSINFPVSSFCHYSEQAMSAIIFVQSLPMWCLSLFGQQSPATPSWRKCTAEEMKSASPTSAGVLLPRWGSSAVERPLSCRHSDWIRGLPGLNSAW